MIKTYSVILSLILLVVVFGGGVFVGYKTHLPSTYVSDTIVSYDSVFGIKYKDKFIYDTIIRVDTLTEVDTVFQLQDYNSKKVHIDTLNVLNSQITIYDTLYRNSLLNRRMEYSLLNKNTTIKVKDNRKFNIYLGGQYMSNNGTLYASGVLVYKSNLVSFNKSLVNADWNIMYARKIF